MKIIEYEEKYLNDVKNLLVELEEYILSIDVDELDQLHPEYKDKMALLDLEEVNENNGKCFLAIEDEKVIGLIMGVVRKYDEYDYLDYKCPKCGVITELVVSKNIRGKGIGKELMQVMEKFLRVLDVNILVLKYLLIIKMLLDFMNLKDIIQEV